MQTGKTNTILDVGGLKIGQAHNTSVKTGVTVLLPDAPARCAVDVRGGGPGTRETDALGDSNLIEHVHAVVLAPSGNGRTAQPNAQPDQSALEAARRLFDVDCDLHKRCTEQVRWCCDDGAAMMVLR